VLSQLTLHHSLCAHYNADLASCEVLVVELGASLTKAERSIERRRALAKAWAEKVERLKKACQSLEEEAQHGKEECAERSDDAVGEERN